MPTISPPILLIGIGNEYCSDDGAGLAVCRALKTKGFPGALVIECECDGTVLMEIWKNAKRVISHRRGFFRCQARCYLSI